MTPTDRIAGRVVTLCQEDRVVTLFVDGMPALRPFSARLEESSGCLALSVEGDEVLVRIDRLVGVTAGGPRSRKAGFGFG